MGKLHLYKINLKFFSYHHDLFLEYHRITFRNKWQPWSKRHIYQCMVVIKLFKDSCILVYLPWNPFILQVYKVSKIRNLQSYNFLYQWKYFRVLNLYERSEHPTLFSFLVTFIGKFILLLILRMVFPFWSFVFLNHLRHKVLKWQKY